MKKTIFVLIFIALTALTFAQENVFTVEAGYIPTASSVDYTDIDDRYFSIIEEALYIELSTRIYAFDYFFAGGSVLSYMFANTKDTAFFPFYTSYTFNTGMAFGAFEVGYEHRCSHPVAALGYIQEPLYKVDSSSDKVYVRATFSF